MPFAFIFVGLVLIISGVRGTSSQLTTLLKSDLTGKKNFIYWGLSILVIGSLGYVDEIKPLSRAFLVLVLVVLILSNGGFFQLFNQAIATISNSNGSQTI
jgi:FtsH-binding integral membrane protein